MLNYHCSGSLQRSGRFRCTDRCSELLLGSDPRC
jgi:hypothetical protein